MPRPAGGSSTRISGLSSAGAAYVIRSLLGGAGAPHLVVLPDLHTAEQLADDLRFFYGDGPGTNKPDRQVRTFFGWELLPFEPISPSAAIVAARLSTLSALASSEPVVVVATVDALMQKVLPAERVRDATLTLGRGDAVLRDELVARLLRSGYVRSSIVEEIGQVAARGAVIDIFPPGSAHPFRIELFGDTIEAVRVFDVATQRSIEERTSLTILPISELLLGAERSGERKLATLLSRVKTRASEIGVPQSAVRPIEEALEEGLPYPGLEQLAPLLIEGMVSPIHYLPSSARVTICDEVSVRAAADDYEQLIAERARNAEEEGRIIPSVPESYLSADECLAALAARTTLFFDRLRLVSVEDLETPDEDGGEGDDAHLESVKSRNAWWVPTVHSTSTLQTRLLAARARERPFAPLADEVLLRHRDGVRVAIVVSSSGRAKRLSEMLAGYDILVEQDDRSFPEWQSAPIVREQPFVTALVGRLSEGVRVVEGAFELIPEREIFPEAAARKQESGPKQNRRFLSALTQLQENDFVVHVDHGVGLYRGLRQIEVDGKIGDFLHLEYADEAKLFLPVDNIGKLQRYRGIDGREPTLSSLGGKAWVQAKRKVKENVAQLAGQLLNLLAEREIATAVAFPDRDVGDEEFAATFPFEETPDQQKAIDAVLADLHAGKPMDRLVCGDVGYGKTEVALRAANKVVHGGAQVAVLVPTTVLADQHYQSFRARFADTAVRVASVSRFSSSAENKETLEDLRQGRVDIIIGTHRLLQKDVHFSNLGLVIIDEEHRFGVAHKERLKRLRAQVHVLTLTATPIPRTLHMSLVGIRDLSVIETPPTNRQAIRTYLATYSPSVVREAIQRELNRGGQVFYIYNRVENIAAIADEVAELVPQARVAYGHGQMKESQLEEVMHRFIQRDIDVLVSTTIVESGLDIPNANTIVIRNAHLFGLAELYQLRGRVGRSSRRAYAYLLIPEPATITGEAKRRLQVLQSLDDLGVGFRLALQDMEIRGAGNLLGKDQSGHIASVGFELYTKILSDAVEELRRRVRQELTGELPPRPDIDPEINIGFPSHIPHEYIPDVAERLILYQRMIGINDTHDASLFAEELSDRFGRYPPDVEVLLESMVFRGTVRRAGITNATYRNGTLSFSFHPDLAPDRERLIALVTRGRFRVTPAGSLQVAIDERSIDRPSDLTRALAETLTELGIRLAA